MSDETLLGELCKICTSAVPKYCCPRCSARTCSLACYKRHKAWSSCSGKRDQAAYVKRSQLATPAGIDHDYNFLSGVERGLDRAERDIERKGIRLDGPSKGTGWKLKDGLQASRTTVRKAPQGLSRERLNKTVWNGKLNCIVWSLEWIAPDGASRIRSCAGSQSIEAAYDEAFAQRPAHKRQKHNHGKDIHIEIHHNTRAPQVSSASTLGSSQGIQETIDQAKCKAASGQDVETAPTSEVNAEAGARSEAVASVGRQAAVDVTNRDSMAGHASGRRQYYYLHVPNAPSPARVVVPIDGEATLTSALADRVVFEFPTIYVLQQSPARLQEPFVTETIWWASTREAPALTKPHGLDDDNVDARQQSSTSGDARSTYARGSLVDTEDVLAS